MHGGNEVRLILSEAPLVGVYQQVANMCFVANGFSDVDAEADFAGFIPAGAQ